MKSVLQTTEQDKADNRSISVTRLMPDCIQPCQIWPCSGKIWASRCSNVSDIYIYIKASNLGQLWVRSKEIQGQESSEGCLWVSRWKILRSRNKWSRNQTRHWAAHPRQNKTPRDKAKNGRKRALRTRTRMESAIRETDMAKYDILEDSRIFYRKSIQRRKTIYLSFFSSTSCQDFMRRRLWHVW